MVIYFSGTGNSKYVAKYIAKEIGDNSLDLFEKLRDKDYSDLTSDTPYVCVTPTYAWQIPHIVRDYLLNTKLTGNNKIYFVMTCGGEIGNANKYLVDLCKKIEMEYMGVAEIVMPENYIALFDAPNDAKAKEIINRADPYIVSAIKNISAGNRLSEVKTGLVGKIFSTIVNPVFYGLCVKDKKFLVLDSCIGCGLCAKKCVMNNITMEDGRPKWNGNCTHCMACICYCPKEAIEYGSHSVGLVRYICEEFEG